MRRIASLIAVAALALTVVSCGKSEPKLNPSQIGTKWGYVNPRGKLIIEPVFDAAERFSCGMAKVTIKGKIGYIGADGQIKIPADYLAGTSFFENKAYVVASGEAPVCIDKTGRVLFSLPDDVLTAYAYSKGVSRLENHGGQVRFIDKLGNAAAAPNVYQVSDIPGYSSIKSDAYYAPELKTILHSNYGENYDMGFNSMTTLGEVKDMLNITAGPSDSKASYRPASALPINGVTLNSIQFSFDGPVMGAAGGGAARGGFGKYKTTSYKAFVTSRQLLSMEYHFKVADPAKGEAFARSLVKEMGDRAGYSSKWNGSEAIFKISFEEL